MVASRLLLLVLSVMLLLHPAAARAQTTQPVGCAGMFPEAEFDTVAFPGGGVTVRGSGLDAALVDRFAEDLSDTAVRLAIDFGALDGIEVCIFAEALPLDATEFGWPEGQSLRAAAFGEEGVVALSAWLIGTVEDAAISGLVHVTQWRASDGTYPQPLGDDVMGWYQSRNDGTTAAIHSQFVRANTGLREPWAAIPWTEGPPAADPRLWNPEFGIGGAGDFTDYVMRNAGATTLVAVDTEAIERLDQQWRQSLFDESGAIPGGSKGWIGGLIAVIVFLTAGVVVAYLNRLSKRRAEERLREAAARLPVPVPLEEESDVRTAIGSTVRSGDARVGAARGRRTPQVDERNRTPSRRERRTGRRDVPSRLQPGDEIFRHPGFDDDR